MKLKQISRALRAEGDKLRSRATLLLSTADEIDAWMDQSVSASSARLWPRRRISSKGRARIIAAQKNRWKKWREVKPADSKQEPQAPVSEA